MKKLLLSMAALTSLLAAVANAQSAAGSWQGTLQTPRGSLRVVIKVALDDDKWKATMYSIDQQGPPIPASTFTKDGWAVKMTITAMNAVYEGKVSADGNSIAGTWSQGGGAPLPLNLTRATPETAWAIPEPPPPPVLMAKDARPAFEVATIKPSDPARPGKLFTVRGRDVITINTTLNDLLTMAYDLHPRQVTGAPAWLESEKFDVTGRPDVPGQPNVAQMKVMFQKLLADRFQLKFHSEKKELPVYAMTVAKTGVKFTKSTRDPNSLPGLFFTPPPMTLNVTNATMAEVVNVLQRNVLDKPVVDQTALPEKYDFTVRFTPDQTQMLGFGPRPPAAEEPDAPPDLFTAMQQQLGLRLESTKAPVDVMVIDHVEKPSEN